MAGTGQKGYRMCTAIAGAVGIVLAAVGIMDYFTMFLTVLSAMIPALAGTMIADYWLIRKARPENFKPLAGVSVPGFVSVIMGALIALVTGHPVFLGAGERPGHLHGALRHRVQGLQAAGLPWQDRPVPE